MVQGQRKAQWEHTSSILATILNLAGNKLEPWECDPTHKRRVPTAEENARSIEMQVDAHERAWTKM